MVMTFPGMLMAAAGFGLLLLAGLTSYRYVRRRMRYETWWAVHLYTYLAVALSFAHQLWTGAPFLGHPLARAWWIALWLFTAGTVLGLPLGPADPAQPAAPADGRRGGDRSARRRLGGPEAAVTSSACRSPAGSSCTGAS